MACDATARLYDVDEDSVVFTKLKRTKKYDEGTVRFRARKGRLIDLDQLHESIWATRLSGGTRSGLVRLQVVAIGRVVKTSTGLTLQVDGADGKFILKSGKTEPEAKLFDQLQGEAENKNIKITGTIDNYFGRWPNVLSKSPPATRHVVLEKFELLD